MIQRTTWRALLASALLTGTLAIPAVAADDASVATPVTTEPVAAAATVAAQTAAAPAAAVAAVADQAAELVFAELPNFHRVDDHVFRGAQPKAGGLAKLKELGVRTIVNLRFERGQSKAEEAEARALGLEYVSIPMYGLIPPTAAQISKVLAILTNPQNGPVFVHCVAGQDRTGVVIACYRIAQMGWTATDAIHEAMGYGMMKAEVLKRQYIRDFYAQTLRRVA
jgi:tyrosine-protein phosphatase SIW14